jgi:hypothetical protein
MKNKNLVKVFISYAQEGPEWSIKEVVKILEKFKLARKDKFQISFFYNKLIEAGSPFSPRAINKLENADIVLLLITRELFHSLHIYNEERPIILELKRKRKKILPIIIEPTSYRNEWAYKLSAAPLPFGYDNPICNSSNRATSWTKVETELEDVIKKVYKRKNSIFRNVEKRRILISSFIIIPFVFLLSFILPEKSSPDFNIKEVEKSELDYFADRYNYFDTPSNENPKKYDDQKQFGRNENINNISRTPEEYQVKKHAEKRNNIRLEITPLNNKQRGGSYDIESYGRYESCQGVNKNGYKPCKKRSKWYIVNESLAIHHKINFSESTHTDIFAIRPFYNDVAEVYFYNGKKMYLSFCVNLEDMKVECELKP